MYSLINNKCSSCDYFIAWPLILPKNYFCTIIALNVSCRYSTGDQYHVYYIKGNTEKKQILDMHSIEYLWQAFLIHRFSFTYNVNTISVLIPRDFELLRRFINSWHLHIASARRYIIVSASYMQKYKQACIYKHLCIHTSVNLLRLSRNII